MLTFNQIIFKFIHVTVTFPKRMCHELRKVKKKKRFV